MLRIVFFAVFLVCKLSVASTQFSLEMTLISDPFTMNKTASMSRIDLSDFQERVNLCSRNGRKGGYRYFTYQGSKSVSLSLDGQAYSIVPQIERSMDYTANPYHFMKTSHGTCEDIRDFSKLERIGFVFKHDKLSTYYVFLVVFPKRNEVIIHETFSGKKYKGLLNAVELH